MKTDMPWPGTPVRGSQTGKPIMALFDLLGRSWSLGIIWQLSQTPLTFRGLQEKCERISPTVLNKRLKELREAKLIANDKDGYQLTDLGRELFTLLSPFGQWSTHWADQLQGQDHKD